MGSGGRSNPSRKRSLPSPGQRPVTSRIHTLEFPTPFPVGPVNVYLIEGREPALIDTGPNTSEAWESLQQGTVRVERRGGLLYAKAA